MSPTPEEPGSPGFGETAWQVGGSGAALLEATLPCLASSELLLRAGFAHRRRPCPCPAAQLAAYAHDRGQDLLGRRAAFRRLYRTSQSEAGAAGEEASLVRHHSAGRRSLELV